MAVRMKDIAEELGVSLVTVSKVLRNKKDVGEATRKRILQRARELNYQPNMLARGLASGKSYAIGLIVPDLLQTFFARARKRRECRSAQGVVSLDSRVGRRRAGVGVS